MWGGNMRGSELHKEDLIDALDSVTWYNVSLAEEIVHWKDPGYFMEGESGTLSWYWDKFINFSLEKRYQIEVIWMICVNLFGDYGTSPRSGWIENKEAFFEFVDEITKTHREAWEQQ
jgi:hypothetical protein